MARIEGFEFIQGPTVGFPYRDDDFQWKLLIHTTETPAGTARRLAQIHQFSPHFWVDPETHERIQSIDTSLAASALQNLSGGVETNADRVIQIETVGYTAETPHWSEAKCKWYGEEVIAPILRAHPEIKRAWLTFAAPGTGGNWARPDAEIRLQGSRWDLYSGILGHEHAPENEHLDPGGILIDKIMHYALKALNEPNNKPPTVNPPTKPPTVNPLNTVVQVGSPRDLVLPVQQLLASWGRLLGGDVDGIYGPRTKAAVKQLQADLNKGGFKAGAVDGKWGPSVYAAYKRWLNSLGTNPPALPPATTNLNKVIGSSSSSSDIKGLQSLLKDEGYYPGAVDGVYGPQTTSGVRKLQRNLAAMGLNPGVDDGLWGPKTYAAYVSYKNTTPISKPVDPKKVEQKYRHQGTRTLKEGMNGADVSEIQFLLNIANNNDKKHFISVDGAYGPRTKAEVRNFQEIYNVFYDPNIGVDGSVGKDTRYALARVLNNKGIW